MSKKITEAIQKAQEENRSIVSKMESLNELTEKEERAFTDLEDKEYQALRLRSDKLIEDIKRNDDLLKRSSGFSMISPIITEAAGLNNNVVNQREADGQKAFDNFLRTCDDTEYKAFENREKDELPNAQQVSKDELGGYLLPQEKFVKEILKGVDKVTLIRGFAKVLPALLGAKQYTIPVVKDRVTAPTWIGETEEVSETKMTFGQKSLTANQLALSVIISRFLVANSSDIQKLVSDDLIKAFAEELELQYMFGDGGNKPLGIFTASDKGIPASRDFTAGNAESLFDWKLFAKNIEKNLKQAYRRHAVLLTGSELYFELDTLEDKNGRPLLRPDLQTGQFSYFKRYKVLESDFIPETAKAGEYLGALIDLSSYYITDSLSMDIQIFKETHAKYNCLNYQATMFTGGMPMIPEACVRIKKA